MQLQKAVMDSLFLFNQSPDHRIYTLVEFNHYAIFPILHSKIRLFYDGDKPFGLVTWAWLTHAEALLFLDGRWMPTEEVYARTIGDQAWGIEFIAPYLPPLKVIRLMMRETYRAGTSHLKSTHKVNWRRLSSPDKLHTRRI
jgi:hemolysin-activating ACP:hemolysin acyltransferase